MSKGAGFEIGCTCALGFGGVESRVEGNLSKMQLLEAPLGKPRLHLARPRLHRRRRHLVGGRFLYLTRSIA